jgi:Fungal specific transcription factor domain
MCLNDRSRFVALVEKAFEVPSLVAVQGATLARWATSGVWIRGTKPVAQALEMGLHRDCRSWIPMKAVQEARKWVFWTTYITDAKWTTIFGQPSMIDDTYVNVDYPIIDGDKTDGGTYHRRLFIELVFLWRIGKKISQYVLARRGQEVTAWEKDQVLQTLLYKLVQWKKDMPRHLQWREDVESNDVNHKVNGRAGPYIFIFLFRNSPSLS